MGKVRVISGVLGMEVGDWVSYDDYRELLDLLKHAEGEWERNATRRVTAEKQLENVRGLCECLGPGDKLVLASDILQKLEEDDETICNEKQEGAN